MARRSLRRAAFAAWGALTVTGVAEGQSLARAGGGPGADPACAGALRSWSLGGDPAPLVGFGTRARIPVALGGGTGAEAGAGAALEAARAWRDRAHDHGRIALGPDVSGQRGPVRAGAMEGNEADGYRYPGPSDARRMDGAVRVVVEVERGPWTAVGDVSVGSAAPRVGVLAAGVVGSGASLLVGALPARVGAGCAESLVLTGSAGPFAGGELRLARVARWPGVGAVSVGVQLGVLPEAGPGNRHPLFHALRMELSPTAALVVGLDRAVIFGGSSSRVPLTARSVGLMLLGVTDTRAKDSDFENQVAAVNVRLRTRIAGRAARVGAEWAADDAGWAFVRVPGLRVAVETRRGPHPEGWSGLEVTWIDGPTGSYPSWYRHGALAWGWTDRGDPLGAPLAGEGTSVLGTWGVTTPGLAVDARAGVVHRGSENLLAPDLEGTGAHASAALTGWRGTWEWSVGATLDVAGATALRTRASILRRF